jgi:phosphoribosyl-ATP pyrophosphohydrolase/phosphoribosyl-AMP cyclohydrolase
LWTKGETSGNFLYVKEILPDCDNDTLLLKVEPAGPVCHTGQDTCFKETNRFNSDFLFYLETVIEDRKQHPQPDSYTTRLFNEGLKKIAQKVGEEAAELVIETFDHQPGLFKNEAADLLYHLLVLLSAKNVKLSEVIAVLEERHGS